MIVRDENYDDDGYLNPLVLISRLVDLIPPRDLHRTPANPRSASFLSRCWMRMGKFRPFVFSEQVYVDLDDRPDEKQPGFEQVVD